jgi:RNA polymerase sigma-70 factor (ECF subfamily)
VTPDDDRIVTSDRRRATPTAASGPPDPPTAEDAIRSDIDEHGGELFHVVRRALGDDELAREVVQDVFVRAWRSHDRYDPARGSRRTWLFAIARNAVIDAVRRRERRPVVVATPEESAAVEPAATDRVVQRLVLEAALRSVTEPHRTALVEIHVRGRPYAEVAAELGVPEGTMRSRVHTGLRRLRDAMAAQGWDDGGA